MSTLKTNNIQHVDRSDPSIIINTDGSVNIAGTMTYEDVTSVDAVGIITGRDNLDAQKQVLVGTGVSVKAGGLNVTAGISTFGQGLVMTSGIGTFLAGTSIDVRGNFVSNAGVSTFTSDVSIADKIVHSGDTNTAIRFPAADTFTVETSGTERVRITSTGSFGVGTQSPSPTFHVHGDSGSELPIHWIRGGSSVGGYLYSDGGGSGIVGGDGVLANTGMYLVTDTRIDFRVNGAERLRIDSAGRLMLATTTEGNSVADTALLRPLIAPPSART